MTKKPVNPVEIYEGVTHTQLSVAKFTGGLTVNGSQYKYFPKEDTLVRKDKVKEYKEKLRAGVPSND